MTTRSIPDRLLVAASGRTTRVIDYRAAAWLYRLDAVDELQPEFSIPHGAWRRGPYDHQRRRIDDLGAPGLRNVLRRRRHGEAPTGSDLETLNLQAWRLDSRLPRPERQWPVFDRDGEFVANADFGFPPRLFVVEDDGLGTHASPDELQYDLNRQNRICDAGYDLRRFTHADVTRRPKYVCRETLRGLIGAPFARKPLQV